ncbi:hypothetical protein [Streptomyces sp. MP131-18]|uniref:hypothetical protein n=1 Tax=Streptomyces sp. MP131-18 TaxID=1857892 RepID=UPI00097BC1C2|nr:hypothetical protein [Streptomyces sp. MP131-18]ONK09355.1 hypothetical protein STBA_00540 [Streptomyces sp. MP131-18]
MIPRSYAREHAPAGRAAFRLTGRAWAGVRQATHMVRLAREARAAGLTVAMPSSSFGPDPYDLYARAAGGHARPAAGSRTPCPPRPDVR